MTVSITTGGDIDSYCTRCRLTLEHIVVAIVDETVAKVKCKTCGSTHRYRGMPAERSKSAGKEGRGPKPLKQPQQPLWEAAVAAAKGPEQPYDMGGSYRTGDLIVHRIFGKGVIRRTFSGKCSVLFRDKERLLVTSNT